MNAKTAWYLFGGGGGATQGGIWANVQPMINVDYNLLTPKLSEEITQCYRQNFDSPVIEQPFEQWVADESYRHWEQPDFLVFTLPCNSFSSANCRGTETAQDLRLAQATAKLIKEVLAPNIWFENVIKWRNSDSWQVILGTLYQLGYTISIDLVNAYHHGVAQRRKRFIARATLNSLLLNIPNALYKPSWYEVIKDLIPSLEPTTLSDKQKSGLTSLFETVKAEQSSEKLPLFDLSKYSKRWLYLVPRIGYYYRMKPLGIDQPYFTIRSSVMIDNYRNCYRDNFINLLNFQDNMAQYTSENWWEGCEVKKLSLRAVARLMSFPDSYRLPENKVAAGRLLGQAIPPMLAMNIFNSFYPCKRLKTFQRQFLQDPCQSLSKPKK